MEEPERRKEEQSCDTMPINKFIWRNLERRREEHNYHNTIARRIACENPSRRMAEQQCDSLQHREARSDLNQSARAAGKQCTMSTGTW